MGKNTSRDGLAGMPEPDVERESKATGAVAKSIHEAAQLLDVSASTISRWLSVKGFPGRSGTRGTPSGFFPIAEIQTWRGRTFGGSGSTEGEDAMRQRLLGADVSLREAKVRQQLGQVATLDDVVGAFNREIASARSKLEEIPERIADAIPTARPKLRRRCYAIADRVVRDVLLELADDIMRLNEGSAPQ